MFGAVGGLRGPGHLTQREMMHKTSIVTIIRIVIVIVVVIVIGIGTVIVIVIVIRGSLDRGRTRSRADSDACDGCRHSGPRVGNTRNTCVIVIITIIIIVIIMIIVTIIIIIIIIYRHHNSNDNSINRYPFAAVPRWERGRLVASSARQGWDLRALATQRNVCDAAWDPPYRCVTNDMLDPVLRRWCLTVPHTGPAASSVGDGFRDTQDAHGHL